MIHPSTADDPSAADFALRAPAVAPRATLRLDATLPPWEGLLAAFASVLSYAAEQVTRAAKDPAKAVHEYRKSIRRARAVVRLVRPLLEARRYREVDGALRRAVLDTSSLRDAEVLEDTLDALPRETAVDAAAAALRERVVAQQARVVTPAGVRDVLARGAERVALLPMRLAHALPARLDRGALEGALRASYRRARRRRREALEAGTDEAIHGWRKRTKELRYQLELLEPAPRRRERALGRVARDLGEVTDLIVLRQAVEAHGHALGPAHADALAGALARLIPARFERAAAAAGPLFEARPRAFARAALAPTPVPSARAPASRTPARAARDLDEPCRGPRPPALPARPALATRAPALPRTRPALPVRPPSAP